MKIELLVVMKLHCKWVNDIFLKPMAHSTYLSKTVKTLLLNSSFTLDMYIIWLDNKLELTSK